MGKSYIISSNEKAFIDKELNRLLNQMGLNENDPGGDFINIRLQDKKNSIGIEQIQYLKSWSKAKPYRSDNKLAVIYDAEKMTLEAQNAMLKMLEEPNKSNNYVLLTKNYSKLLETILSRCELILDTSVNLKGLDVVGFIKMSSLEKMEYINKLTGQKDIQLRNDNLNELLLGLLKYYRAELHLGKSVVNKIEIVNHTKKLLDSNVSPKNALIYLCLNIDN
jgi:DNA polymerase III delta prime subunit